MEHRISIREIIDFFFQILIILKVAPYSFLKTVMCKFEQQTFKKFSQQ